MGANYYYLVSSLPTLEFGEFSSVAVQPLFEKVVVELTPDDVKLLQFLRTIRDIENLRSKAEDWQAFRALGNIDVKAFIDEGAELNVAEEWEQYQLSQKGEKPIPVDSLWLRYFDEGMRAKNAFIRRWIKHELTLWTACAVLRRERFAAAQDRASASSVFEVSENELILDILAASRLPDFGLAHEYDWASTIRELFEQDNPVTVEMALDKFRWDFIDGLTANCYFSYEVVLGYALKLLICERWSRLDKKTGEDRLEKILGGTIGE
ncbi:DUF2764 family protein [candidate division KSB1 bacterium]|nr:DUF2764 family protein [candidate division KSB1 bacterium]